MVDGVLPTLLVLAAGQGNRFGGLKQMEAVGPGGETLLDYSVYDALRCGFGRVVFVVGAAFAEAFEARVTRRYAGSMAVACVCQYLEDLPPGCVVPAGRARPWGTLHAVWAARGLVQGPFAVVNADDFYGRAAFQGMAHFLRQTVQQCGMVGYRLDQTLSGSGGVNRGLCQEQGGLLQAVVEHTDIRLTSAGRCVGRNPQGEVVALPPDAVASMNLWGFAATIFEPMGRYLAAFLDTQGRSTSAECYLPSLVNHLLQEGLLACRVLHTDAPWFGITYAQDKPMASEAVAALVKAGVYPLQLWPAAKAPESG